ncbi:MAG TPA: hypothetical protein VFL78_01805 [Rhodanobacteraceae bacterium]|nr:hypothetical protein [Rhodanobacteraceae bacterium]
MENVQEQIVRPLGRLLAVETTIDSETDLKSYFMSRPSGGSILDPPDAGIGFMQ